MPINIYLKYENTGSLCIFFTDDIIYDIITSKTVKFKQVMWAITKFRKTNVTNDIPYPYT